MCNETQSDKGKENNGLHEQQNPLMVAAEVQRMLAGDPLNETSYQLRRIATALERAAGVEELRLSSNAPCCGKLSESCPNCGCRLHVTELDGAETCPGCGYRFSEPFFDPPAGPSSPGAYSNEPKPICVAGGSLGVSGVLAADLAAAVDQLVRQCDIDESEDLGWLKEAHPDWRSLLGVNHD